jgi:16S rRNA A1518/A1519 N6-dimethyltransferase RsmA/KsgA/DIM1 with predicted DNA glycosylase/AP lyase activity
MIHIGSKRKVEYGDFQTPLELTQKICHKLSKLGVNPDIIIEPTCGTGNFIQAAAHSFQLATEIIGVEIDRNYLQEISQNKQLSQDKRIRVIAGDFFDFNWNSLIDRVSGKILILGNFPWITNSKQSVICGNNLPPKTNFQKHNGLDAITGKSNFDISEWMLINIIQYLHKRDAYLAMLCKTSVSRKILNYIYSQNLNLTYCANYRIDTQKYFNAAVDACLLFCQFYSNSKNYFCDVFNNFNDLTYYRIGYRKNTQVRDTDSFDKLEDLYNPKMGMKWRSGIKHDCSKIMELRQIDRTLINGLGEIVDIEQTCIFPLIKGSDVARNRINNVSRYVLVTQRFIGESTERIQHEAPKTWKYLESHANYLDRRKSKIYKNNHRFSIFGVGDYTFAPWKIAICGLYKQLSFRLISNLDNKPVIFDDTVYFLSFEDRESAEKLFKLLNSPIATQFYSSLIFWDEKRPIKSTILNSLNLLALENKVI